MTYGQDLIKSMVSLLEPIGLVIIAHSSINKQRYVIAVPDVYEGEEEDALVGMLANFFSNKKIDSYELVKDVLTEVYNKDGSKAEEIYRVIWAAIDKTGIADTKIYRQNLEEEKCPIIKNVWYELFNVPALNTDDSLIESFINCVETEVKFH